MPTCLRVLQALPDNGRALSACDLRDTLRQSDPGMSARALQTAIEQLVDAGLVEQPASGELRRSGPETAQVPASRDFAELLANLASELLSFGPDEISTGVTLALERVSRFVGADRAYVFDYDHQRNMALYSHEWCNTGIAPQMSAFPELGFDTFSSWMDAHLRGDSVIVENVLEISDNETRNTLLAQNIKSTAAVPMMQDGDCVGCIGFDMVRNIRRFSADELRLLKVLAQLLINVRQLNRDRQVLAIERQKLEIIVEGTAAGTWIFWLEDGRLEINDLWASMLGYTLKELQPISLRTWEDLSHPDDLSAAKALLARNVEDETSYYEAVVRMRHKQGHWVYVLTRGRMMIRDELGKGVVIAGIHQDITEREMSRQAQQELSDIVTHSPVVAIRWQNQEGWPVSYCSDNIKNFGYVPEDITKGNITYSNLIHPEDIDSIRDQVAQHIKNGPDEYRLEYRIMHGHGHWIWIEDHTWLNRNQSGDVIRINGVLSEISARKEAIDTLKRSERTLLTAQRIANIGNWTLDFLTGKIKGQGEIAKLLGVDADMFPSSLEEYLELIHPEDRKSIISVIENTAIKKLPDSGIEHRLLTPNQEMKWVRLNSEFIYDATDAPISMLATLQDITYSKRLEFESAALAIVLDNSNDIAVLKSPDQRYLAVSQAFLKAIERKRDQVIGRTDREVFEDFSTKSDLEDITSSIYRVLDLEPGRHIETEKRIKFADGSTHDCLIREFPIYQSDEKTIVGAAFLGIDITDRNIALRKIAENEARFRALFDEAPASIVIYDRDTGAVIDANTTAHKWYNASSVEDLNMQRKKLHHSPPYTLQAAQAMIQKAASEGMQTFEWYAEGLDGKPIWERVTLTPVEIDSKQRVVSYSIDFSDRVLAEKALADREALYTALFELLPIGVSLSDMETGAFEDVNFTLLATTGYAREELLALRYEDMISKEHADVYAEILKETKEKGYFDPVERDFIRKDGSLYPARVRGICITGRDERARVLSLVEDISQDRAQKERLSLLASVFSYSHDGIVITDPEVRIIELNDTFCAITGHARDDMIGKNPSFRASGMQDDKFYREMWRSLEKNDFWSGRLWSTRKSGEKYAEQITISVIRDDYGRIKNYVGIFSDVTDQAAYQEELERLALHDDLTGLPNRVLLSRYLNKALESSRKTGDTFGLVYIDIDNFKEVNDTYGHDMGDRYLLEISRRLTRLLEHGEIAARMGGDEFLIIAPDIKESDPNHPFLIKLQKGMRQPVIVDGIKFSVSASVGVSLFPHNDVSDGDQLIRYADQAMYISKRQGKNKVTVFDSSVERTHQINFEKTIRFFEALHGDELELYYQPKLDAKQGVIAGVEALLRWNHPEEGLLGTSSFIDLINKDSGLATSVAKWVIKRAIRDCSEICIGGTRLGVSININIPDKVEHQSELIDFLCQALSEYPSVTPDLVTLEVLESTFISDAINGADFLAKIRALGVRVSLDDFGTGYSSLVYLKKFPLDEIKIDGSFVRDMLFDTDSLNIVHGIIVLARALSIPVVAEGVEKSQDIVMLLRLGCYQVQGYAISRPMPLTDLTVWLAEWRPDPFLMNVKKLPDNWPVILTGLSAHREWLSQLQLFWTGALESPPNFAEVVENLGRLLEAVSAAGFQDDIKEIIRDLHGEVSNYIAPLEDSVKLGDMARIEIIHNTIEESGKYIEARVLSAITGGQ